MGSEQAYEAKKCKIQATVKQEKEILAFADSQNTVTILLVFFALEPLTFLRLRAMRPSS